MVRVFELAKLWSCSCFAIAILRTPGPETCHKATAAATQHLDPAGADRESAVSNDRNTRPRCGAQRGLARPPSILPCRAWTMGDAQSGGEDHGQDASLGSG